MFSRKNIDVLARSDRWTTAEAFVHTHGKLRGLTIPEVLAAVCVVAIGLIAIWTSAAQCIHLAQAHRETIAATETLLRRVEDCRAAGWNTIVSADSIKADILQIPSVDSCYLQNLEEQITITPYPAVTPAPKPIIVQRHSNGLVEVVSQPPSGLYLRSLLAVRADIQVTWTSGPTQRSRQRVFSTVISLEGLLR